MKKRLFGLFVAVAMVTSSLWTVGFASVGRVSNIRYSDIVKYYNNGEDRTNFSSTILTVDNGTLCFDNKTGTVQSTYSSLEVDNTSEDTYGALSFKIMADAVDEKASGGGGIAFMLDGGAAVHCFAMRNTMGMRNEENYCSNFTEGDSYSTGVWYTVGIVFKRNKTFDYYLNGEFKKNVSFAAKEWSGDTLKLMCNVIGESKIYIDELTWSKYFDKSFIAEVTDVTEEKVQIKFSEPVASFDASQVKLYNCETGEEMNCIAELNDEYIDVTLPDGLMSGGEYRIELSDVKGSLGRELYTDNVYFNFPISGQEITDTIITENFSGYQNTFKAHNDFEMYTLDKWIFNKKWNTDAEKVSFVRAVSEDTNTVMQIGQTAKSSSGVHAYIPFGKDIKNGKVSISFKLKPEKITEKWEGTHATFKAPNFYLMAYPDGIHADDNTWGIGVAKSIGINNTPSDSSVPYGRVLTGIKGLHIINPKEQILRHLDNWESIKALSIASDGFTVTDTDAIWHDIKVELDFNNKTVTYYLNDTKYDGEASLTTLGIDGIQGISFGTNPQTPNASVLIDDIFVTHTYTDASSGGVKSVRFNDYYGDKYGTATTITTISKEIEISFWSDNIDEESLSGIRLEDISGGTVGYEGEWNEQDNVYTIKLDDYLSKNTTYTLKICGVTENETGIDDYIQEFKTNENGVVIVEPIYTSVNAVKTGSGSVSANDTLRLGTYIINTTGETKKYAFSSGLYDNENMTDFDFKEIEIDGSFVKSANVYFDFVFDEEQASTIDKARAFLWEGMNIMKRIVPSVEFTNTSAE